jgi:chromosome partitioning protein
MGALGKVIAIGNLKGGVGKSTLAVNLGCALASAGLEAVVIDTDPQQTASAWARGRRLPCRVRARPIRELGSVGGWLGELAEARAAHARVLIDLPATLSPALAAAFLAADAILVPTSFSPVDLAATRRTVHRAKLAAAERGADPPLVLVVPMLVRRGLLGRPLGKPPADAGVPVAPPVGHDPAFGEAFERGDWIGGVAPRSRAHRELLGVMRLVETGLAGVRLAATGGEPAPAAAAAPDAPPQGGGEAPPGGSRRRQFTTAAAV